MMQQINNLQHGAAEYITLVLWEKKLDRWMTTTKGGGGYGTS